MTRLMLPFMLCFHLTACGTIAADAAGAGIVEQPASTAVPTWIAGCWAGERGGERFHERWIAADPATMLGLGHTVKDGKTTAFEFLRIVAKGDRPTYVAQPGGAPPTEFVASSQSDERIVFENPAHDFPKRVIYERSGTDRLTASIDGGATSRERVEFAMTRQPCDR